MKNQFRKGIRQTIKGVLYDVYTFKVDASTKILIKNEVRIDLKPKKK